MNAPNPNPKVYYFHSGCVVRVIGLPGLHAKSCSTTSHRKVLRNTSQNAIEQFNKSWTSLVCSRLPWSGILETRKNAITCCLSPEKKKS